nr:MAG TPA: Guanosine-3',5'-bis(Diphosphate) 3'-pyrophosphohydrolase development, TGS domain, predominantly [Caudoviricetes sp.]
MVRLLWYDADWPHHHVSVGLVLRQPAADALRPRNGRLLLVGREA